MSKEQYLLFKSEVLSWCEVVRETWEFKKIRLNISNDLLHEANHGELPSPTGRRVIFCDLDGVLADFCEGVRRIFSKKPEEIPPSTLWSVLAKTPHFYSNLPWMSDGKTLWDSIKHLEPTIITAAPRGSWATKQKIEWVRKNLGPEVPVIVTTEKHKYCPIASPEAILIDDMMKWCKPWEEAGGTAIIHENTSKTLKALMDLGVNISTDQSIMNEMKRKDLG
jgi:hypothetical protein